MGTNSRDRRHKPKPVHVAPELLKLVSPDRSARITHCRLRLTIGLARTEGRQRSNSAHRARRRIDAFTATEDRLPPLDSIWLRRMCFEADRGAGRGARLLCTTT